MTTEDWFVDDADAKEYLGEVGRLWSVWLLGLGVLVFSRGLTAAVAGVVLLITMFLLMRPLQDRVYSRYADDSEARPVPRRETLSQRDKALRQLTYGRAPFAEAVEKRGLGAGLNAIPWVVMVATLAAAAAVAVSWFEG